MLSLAVAAAAIACWPRGIASRRALALFGGAAVRSRRWPRRACSTWAAVGGAALLGAVVFGPAGVLAGLVAGATAARLLRGRVRRREHEARLSALAEALGNLVAEVRAGVHPVPALESVGRDALPAVGRVLSAMAAAARLGEDLSAVVARTADEAPALSDHAARLARSWTMAQRHGMPIADVLESARRDVEASARCTARLRARMAGPRSSAAVLSCLPALGLLLGEVMGARPLSVLGWSAAGGFLLLIGVALLCSGALWCARLTRWDPT